MIEGTGPMQRASGGEISTHDFVAGSGGLLDGGGHNEMGEPSKILLEGEAAATLLLCSSSLLLSALLLLL